MPVHIDYRPPKLIDDRPGDDKKTGSVPGSLAMMSGDSDGLFPALVCLPFHNKPTSPPQRQGCGPMDVGSACFWCFSATVSS